ncbi:YfcC family protein [Flexibacterium corallicola]|uniref:YfcC family protein n=1 Tax=Flexibacterium corallicola TaxID=3037259 RepID=UPI00286EFE96|nr:YfcC family protein [Pseudovibrio sp. M1P-2-3]
MKKPQFPSAFTILFSLIIAAVIATWIIPAGKYERVMDETLGRALPIPGSYHLIEPEPQGVVQIFLAPISGFYDPVSRDANAVDVSVFVLIIGGFLMVVTQTGALDAGISRIMKALRGREFLMVPILMLFFAAGGTIYGMAEETLAFYAIIIPVVRRAGYDSLTGVAVIMLGAGIGCLGSTVNPFATVIASNAAGIPFTDGLILRLIILAAGWLICTLWVMRYAAQVRKDLSSPLTANIKDTEDKGLLQENREQTDIPFTRLHALVLFIFVSSFAILVYGVSILGWWMAHMSALFLASAILVGLVTRMGEAQFIDSFIKGAQDLLSVALIIAVARGITVVMDNGAITDTILHWSESALKGLGDIAFINVLFWLEILLSFLVPSTSGLAVLSMPIMAPLASFTGITADLVVTAYQSASGLVNLVTPTSAVVMGGLAFGRVPYDRWVRFVAPLLVILFILITIALSISV